MERKLKAQRLRARGVATCHPPIYGNSATSPNGEQAVAMNYMPADTALKSDVWIYRIVVATLGVVLPAAQVADGRPTLKTSY